LSGESVANSSGRFVLVPAPGTTANSSVELALKGWAWM
jgi:hypothetical protein